jgi:hypothetical protein
MHATKLRLATFDAVNHIKTWYRCLIVACLGHLGVVTADAQVQSADSKHIWAPVEWSGYGGYAFPLRQEMEALVTGHAWGGSVAWGRKEKETELGKAFSWAVSMQEAPI